MKIDWNSSLSGSKDQSGNITFSLFNPSTKEEYNISKECADVPIIISIPPNPSINIDFTSVNNFRKAGFNVLDPKDPLFSDRCITYVYNNKDTTLDFRKDNFFQNKSIGCSAGCVFSGFDSNNYTICNCTQTVSINSFPMANVMTSISNSNIFVFKCYKTALTGVK